MENNEFRLREVLLLYNIPETECRRYEKICEEIGVDVKYVEKEMYEVPLGYLAFGNEDGYRDMLTSAGEKDFSEPMMVMGGFPQEKIRQFLNLGREEGLPRIDLKAMITEHNISWSSAELCRELSREHEEIQKMLGK